MITRASVVLGIVLAGVLQAEELAAPPQSTGANGQDAMVQGGTVYLHETFDSYEIGSVPKIPQLQRVDMVTVVDGGGRVGSGKVARFDPARVAVGGTSAGGHVALWTSIEKAPPGSDPATSPKSKPAALFLVSAVTDTSPETGYTASRFGDDAIALSPVHRLDAEMPPMVIVHAANDELVHYSTAVALHNKLESTGNACELITVPQGGHGFSSEFREWNVKVRAKMEELFKREGLLPAVR